MAEWPGGIRPRGRGLEIRIWRHGKVAYSEIIPGDLGRRHLAHAVTRREALMARAKLGLALHEEDQEGVPLFEHCAQEYMTTLDAKRSTSLSYENIINRHWMPAFAGQPIDEISQKDVRRELSAVDVSGKTKRNLLIPLRGIFEHAEVTPNPAAGIRIKKHQKPKVDRYLPDERDELLAELTGQSQAYFALLFAAGLRPGEALGLLWTDWDGEELDVSKQITRRRLEPTTKTCERRRVLVPSWARPYINALPSRFAKGHVFVNSFGRPMLDTDDFNKAWAKAHRRLGIPYRIPYTCRHTRAAELLSTGISRITQRTATGRDSTRHRAKASP